MPFAQITTVSLHDDVDALLHTWVIGWVSQQVLQDPLNLYQAPNFYPYPNTLAYSNSMVPQSLLALPIILATGNLALAFNLSIWFALIMNGYAMYLLLRAWQAGFWGALVGGFIFAFGFFHLIHLGHLDVLSSEWIPLSLLYLHLAIESRAPKHFALYSLFFLLSSLSSFYYAFMTAAVVAVYFLSLLILVRGRFHPKVWAGLALSAGGAFILLLPFGLPYIQVSRDLGLTRSADQVMAMSAILSSYLASTTSNPAFTWVHQLFPAPNFESLLSPGLLALPLVAYGLLRRSAGARTGALVAIAAVGVVLSLGIQTRIGQWTIPLPYRWLYDYVPGFESMRAVARWGVLVLLSAAALAGLGVSDLLRRLALPHPPGKAGRGEGQSGLGMASRQLVMPASLAVIMLIGLTLEYNQSPTPALAGQPFTRPLPPVYEWLKTQPYAPVAELPMGEPSEIYVPDYWYQYYSLFYHKPLVNGRSGFSPPAYDEVYWSLLHFPSAEALDFLRSYGVQYVVVHPRLIPDWESAKRRLALFKNDLRLAATFGDDYIYEPSPQRSQQTIRMTLVLPATASPSALVRGTILAMNDQIQGAVFTQRGSIQIHLRWIDASGQVRQDETIRRATDLMVQEGGAMVPFELRVPSQEGSYRLLADVTGMPEEEHLEQKVDVQPPAPASGPAVQLVGYSIGRRAARSGEDLPMTLFWRVRNAIQDDYTVFLDVLDASGKNRADLNVPLDPHRPTIGWQVGEVMVERYLVPLPGGLPQGRYSVAVRLSERKTDETPPILGPEGETDTTIILEGAAHIGAGWRQSPPQPGHPLAVGFGNGCDLVGYDLKTTSFVPGESVPLVLYWQSRDRTRDDYTVFIHLLDANRQMVAQADAPPVGGSYPTSAWNVGEWVRDPRRIQLPDTLAPGDYTLQIGWYRPDTGERAVAQVGDGVRSDHVDLGTIHVR